MLSVFDILFMIFLYDLGDIPIEDLNNSHLFCAAAKQKTEFHEMVLFVGSNDWCLHSAGKFEKYFYKNFDLDFIRNY